MRIFNFIRLFPGLKSICYEGGYTFDHQIPITLFMIKGNILFKNSKLNKNLKANKENTDFELLKNNDEKKKEFFLQIFFVFMIKEVKTFIKPFTLPIFI